MAANETDRPTTQPFLTAEWRCLAMLNYEVPAEILERRLPQGVELDRWQGKALVSLVGFRFVHTRVMGVAIPWHCNFDEVNLRYYVRRNVDGVWRRGVVFIRELVPRTAIAAVARMVYDEPYLAVPMHHNIQVESGIPQSVEYGWKFRGESCHLRVSTRGELRHLVAGEEAGFITEHYWGYTRRRDGSTSEYQVTHPPWRVMETRDAAFQAPVAELYGREFAEPLASTPTSALLAEGSAIIVYRGRKLS